MAQDSTLDMLNSNAKEIYSDEGILNLVPNDIYLLKNIPFSAAQRNGRYFFQPVQLTDEHGFTYADEDDGLYTLNDSIALVLKHAEVPGQQLTGRSAISLKEAAAATSGGKQAFVSSTEYRTKALLDSAAKRLEIAMIHGRSATGLARSVTGSTASSTQFVFTIPAAEWASGIWSGAINAEFECFNDTGTQIGSAAVTCYNVDFGTKQVSMSGASGDITAINTAIASGIVLKYRSANGKEMYGIDSIITNAGTLFNIDAAAYALWKGNTFSAGSAALTMELLLKSLIVPMGKGLQEDVVVLCSNATFVNLNEDEAALRMFDSSYKPELTERGNKRIRYFYQHGMMDIVSHNMVKEGVAYVLKKSDIRRVGASDLTFNCPGREGEMFDLLQDKNGFQFRVYADQAIFLKRPGCAVKIVNIVNS